MTKGWRVETSETLDEGEVGSVLALVEEASAADGFTSLNEAARLHLRHARPGVLHVLARRVPRVVSGVRLPGQPELGRAGDETTSHEPHSWPTCGYAQLAPEGATATGQVVVSPLHRRVGLGSALLDELIERTAKPLQIWVTGDSPAARALAERRSFRRARELLIMTRSLSEEIPQPPLLPGVVVRSFVPGADETPWLALNARAFRDHPEQGQLTRADLGERMAEAWFDPAGFFVATRGDEMVGFHWTKQHPDRLGEVYVLGVDPAAGGKGLGRLLLVHGLRYLQQQGNATVQLYVEGDHDRAVGLYERYGFTVASRDVMYAQP